MDLKLQDSVGLEWFHRNYSNSATRDKTLSAATDAVFGLLWFCCVIKTVGLLECLQRPETSGARKWKRGTVVMVLLLSTVFKEAPAPFLMNMIYLWLCAQVMGELGLCS